jgi:hypothetical protein
VDVWWMVNQVQRGLSERRDAYEGGIGPGLLMSIERQRRVDRRDLRGKVERRAKSEGRRANVVERRRSGQVEELRRRRGKKGYV